MYSCVREDPRWGRLLWLTDGRTEVAAALDFGIRIVHLACAGMENLFYRQDESLRDGLATGAGWRLYGGHRFWLAPESEQSYYPDCAPVRWSALGEGILLLQEPDPWLGVEKSLELRFDGAGRIRVIHRARNVSDEAISCGLWAISSMAAGCRLQVPFVPPPRPALTPTRFLALWDCADLADRRLEIRADRVCAQQMDMDPPLKIGLYTRMGEAAVEGRGQRFVKQFGCAPGRAYPDNNCNFELYLCRHMMEVESLGPVTVLEPGESADHCERWHVCPLAGEREKRMEAES